MAQDKGLTANKAIAPVLHRDDRVVVRGSWEDNKGKQEYRVRIHQVVDGQEMLPRGYWIGSNMAIWEAK
jgi:hypothetical protein